MISKVIRRLVREAYHVRHRRATVLSRGYKERFNPNLGCSQGGEDGIIQEIFRRLDVQRGWFVEVGAWDGVWYSNTYALLQRGWSGAGIECDPEKCRVLQENMERISCYLAICERVSPAGAHRLDAILARTTVPREFHLLSVDIDSHDYWVWDSLREYRPTVVVIEYNPFFSAAEARTLRLDAACDFPNFGASAAALDKLGRSKGYTLVAYTAGLNLFFVREDLARGTFEPLPVTCVPAEPKHPDLRGAKFIEV